MVKSTRAPPREVMNIVRECMDKLERIDREMDKTEVDLVEVKKRIEEIRPYVSILTSKWVPEILYALALRGHMSFNELKQTLGISSRVLSDKLQELQEIGLLLKESTSERPKRVSYTLTEKGKKVVYALTPFLLAIYFNKE
ncbi:MAG: helix-turn-helix transcriptional regulator [Crenarchaeota archaeon]|nr:helix-turn-helix transcriptional regulator [Thermoproteota archaeon]